MAIFGLDTQDVGPPPAPHRHMINLNAIIRQRYEVISIRPQSVPRFGTNEQQFRRELSPLLKTLQSRDLRRRIQPSYIGSETELFLISRLANRFRLS